MRKADYWPAFLNKTQDQLPKVCIARGGLRPLTSLINQENGPPAGLPIGGSGGNIF